MGQGSQPDGTRLGGWTGREADDPWSQRNRRSQPCAQTNEAVSLENTAVALLDQQGGMKFMPYLDKDPGVMQQDLRECIYGVKPWLDLQPAKHALKNEVLLLWGSLAQSARAFENVCFRCMTAEDEGGNTGLQMVMDMPLANVGCTKQAKSTAKWLERLLNRPDCWPFAKGDAGPHAPRLCQLRKIFLVEAKWMEARYLVQPMMAARERAFEALDETPSEGYGENLGMGSM